MKIYATSDQHFMHKNIIKYANRPFELSNKGMTDCVNTIVNNYNSIIKDDDLVYHVGDLSHGRNQSEDILRYIFDNLNGRKILIKGNHDNFRNEFYNEIFEEVLEYKIFDNFFMCHYPCFKTEYTSDDELNMLEILKQTNLNIVVHGHCHNKNPNDLNDKFKRLNVCVDFEPNNYTPVDITRLIIL
jgi:calcineurin-like phosphoesterase family protein